MLVRIRLQRARVWDAVSRILKDPERLRASLEYMIEQERHSAHGDPAFQTERRLEEISEAGHKRARYQEMAAEGLIDFDELRALRRRTDNLAQLERDRDGLLESYAELMP